LFSLRSSLTIVGILAVSLYHIVVPDFSQLDSVSAMEVYLVEQDDMKRVPESELDREAKLEQRLVRTDGAKIGDVEVLYVGRQGSPGEGGIFDILGVDERGDTVVVELKRGRTPRDVVAQALEYAGEIRNVDYDYLDERYREFLRDEQGYTNPEDIPSLRQAHREYFDLEEPPSEREFNDEQRLVVVGTDFQDVSLNMADFLREHGIDVVAVEYNTYRDDEESVELLTTDGVRRPLSEEPTTTSSTSDKTDYSKLIREVRDCVYSEVADITHHEDLDDMSGVGSRRLGFGSNHPDHPDPVLYRFTPRIIEEGRAVVSIGLFGGSDEQKESIREVVMENADQLENYKTSDEPEPNSNLVYLEFELTDRQPDADDDEFIDAVAEEMTRLIEFYHPKFVEEVTDDA